MVFMIYLLDSWIFTAWCVMRILHGITVRGQHQVFDDERRRRGDEMYKPTAEFSCLQTHSSRASSNYRRLAAKHMLVIVVLRAAVLERAMWADKFFKMPGEWLQYHDQSSAGDAMFWNSQEFHENFTSDHIGALCGLCCEPCWFDTVPFGCRRGGSPSDAEAVLLALTGQCSQGAPASRNMQVCKIHRDVRVAAHLGVVQCSRRRCDDILQLRHKVRVRHRDVRLVPHSDLVRWSRGDCTLQLNSSVNAGKDMFINDSYLPQISHADVLFQSHACLSFLQDGSSDKILAQPRHDCGNRSMTDYMDKHSRASSARWPLFRDEWQTQSIQMACTLGICAMVVIMCRSTCSATSLIARSGPNSGGGGTRVKHFSSLWILVCFTFVIPASSARVVDSTTESTRGSDERLIGSNGPKHSGEQVNAIRWNKFAFSFARKRSYKRACRRAILNPEGTMYKGRWRTAHQLNAQYASQITPTSRHRTTTTSTKPEPQRLHIFCWNAGGLGAGLWDEVMCWMDESIFDIVCITETKMAFSSSWTTRKWHCFHNGISKESRDSGGVLTLVSRRLCGVNGVRSDDISPGRISHIRVDQEKHGIDIFSVYQKAWSNRTKEVAQKRKQLWNGLEEEIRKTPARNDLILMGDFNVSPGPSGSEFGPATWKGTKYQASDGWRLIRIAQDNQLVALNTWEKSQPGHTFEFGDLRSQVDYVLVRKHRADRIARSTCPARDLPVGQWRAGALHFPLTASVPKPWRVLKSKSSVTDKIHVEQLIMDSRTSSERLGSLRHKVACQLQTARVTGYNDILLQCVRECYPFRPVSLECSPWEQTETKWKANRMWLLFRQMKSSRVSSMGNVTTAWRCWARFVKAHRAYKKHVREIRKQRHLKLLQDAEKAAEMHDMRTLYRVVEKIAPKKRRTHLNIKAEDGSMQSQKGMMRTLWKHCMDRYQSEDAVEIAFHAKPRVLHDPVNLEMEEILRHLLKTPERKAVPAHWAPSAVWKICASEIAAAVKVELQHTWGVGVPEIAVDWSRAWLVFLAKQNKSGHKAKDYRAVGLQCPLGKAIIAALTSRISPFIHKMAMQFPLHGYIPKRGTFTALRQVFQHCSDVRKLCEECATSIHDLKDGKTRPRCVGGLQVFLDLSSAFDLMPRSKLYRALLMTGAPQAEIELIMQWHVDATYYFNNDCEGRFIQTSRGVRQGCKAAPTLWLAFSVLCCSILDEKLGAGWCAKHAVIYADDHHVSFIFKDQATLDAAVRAVGVLYETLAEIGMEVSAPKSACIFTFRGTRKNMMRKQYVRMIKDQSMLRVPQGQSSIYIPIVTEKIYLGAVASYGNFEKLTFEHRASIARQRYFQLKPILNNRSYISRRDRLKMWLTCIWTTLSYALTESGITFQCHVQLQSMMMKHVRAIVVSPAHIDKVSDQDLMTCYKLQAPCHMLLRLITKKLEDDCSACGRRASPDPFRAAEWASHVRSGLQHVCDQVRAGLVPKVDCGEGHTCQQFPSIIGEEEMLETCADQPVTDVAAHDIPETINWKCKECDRAFDSQKSLRLHELRAHKILVDKNGAFNKQVHAVGGVPTCSGCKKKFTRWSGLERHIRERRCLKPINTTGDVINDSGANTVQAVFHSQVAQQRLLNNGVQAFAADVTYGRSLQQTCAL